MLPFRSFKPLPPSSGTSTLHILSPAPTLDSILSPAPTFDRSTNQRCNALTENLPSSSVAELRESVRYLGQRNSGALVGRAEENVPIKKYIRVSV